MAVTEYRAHVIRSLVDDEHLSFSEIGDVIGVSRQMVARLYRKRSSTSDEIPETGQD